MNSVIPSEDRCGDAYSCLGYLYASIQVATGMNGSTYPPCAAFTAVANVALLALPGHLEELDQHEELVCSCRLIDLFDLVRHFASCPLATDVIPAGLLPAEMHPP